MEDLVKRLRSFASGCRGSMWQSRDMTIALCDEAADRIEALTAEIRSMQARLEAADKLEEAAIILLNHLEITLDDDAWNKVSVSVWNNVTCKREAYRALKETGHD